MLSALQNQSTRNMAEREVRRSTCGRRACGEHGPQQRFAGWVPDTACDAVAFTAWQLRRGEPRQRQPGINPPQCSGSRWLAWSSLRVARLGRSGSEGIGRTPWSAAFIPQGPSPCSASMTGMNDELGRSLKGLIRRPVGCRQRVYPFASRSRRPIKGWEPVLRDPACAHTLCSHRVSIWHRDCSPTSAAIVQNQLHEPFPQ